MASKGRYISRGPWTRVLEKLGADKGLKLKGKGCGRGLTLTVNPDARCAGCCYPLLRPDHFPPKPGWGLRILNTTSGLQVCVGKRPPRHHPSPAATAFQLVTGHRKETARVAHLTTQQVALFFRKSISRKVARFDPPTQFLLLQSARGPVSSAAFQLMASICTALCSWQVSHMRIYVACPRSHSSSAIKPGTDPLGKKPARTEMSAFHYRHYRLCDGRVLGEVKRGGRATLQIIMIMSIVVTM